MLGLLRCLNNDVVEKIFKGSELEREERLGLTPSKLTCSGSQ